MPTTSSGTLSDTNFPGIQRDYIDVDDEIAMLEGSVGLFAPQFTRTMKKAAKSQKVEWLEDEAQPVYTAIGTDALATGVDTTMDVTAGTGQHIKVNDVLHIESTGENVLVTGFNSVDNVTIIRAWGTTAGAAAIAGVGVVRIANNSPQGASYPTPKATVVVGQYNLQQITRTSFALVKSATMEQFRGEVDPVAYQKAKHLKEHLREIENTIWLGQRFASTAATTNHGVQPQLSTGGIDSFVQTNKTLNAGAATFTQTAWETWLRTQAFAFGEVLGSKLVVISPVVASVLAGYPRNNLAPPSTEVSKWGLRLRTYVSVLGDVNLVVHPDWRQYGTTAASAGRSFGLGGAAYSLDMDHLYLKGFRTTKYMENRQNPGDDAFVAEYLTEFAVVVKQERLFAKLTGIVS